MVTIVVFRDGPPAAQRSMPRCASTADVGSTKIGIPRVEPQCLASTTPLTLAPR